MFAHDHDVSHQVLVGGYIILALVLIATLGLTGWLLARRLHRPAIAIQLLVVLVLGGVSFQGVHLFDHLLQLGYWFAHPTEAPWMPPWSRVAVDDLATLAGYQGDMAAGMELLHLAGNWIFFAVGVVPIYLALRSLKTERGEMHAPESPSGCSSYTSSSTSRSRAPICWWVGRSGCRRSLGLPSTSGALGRLRSASGGTSS